MIEKSLPRGRLFYVIERFQRLGVIEKNEEVWYDT